MNQMSSWAGGEGLGMWMPIGVLVVVLLIFLVIMVSRK